MFGVPGGHGVVYGHFFFLSAWIKAEKGNVFFIGHGRFSVPNCRKARYAFFALIIVPLGLFDINSNVGCIYCCDFT